MTKIKKVIENCFLRNKIIDKLIKYHIDKQKKLNNIKEIADKYINDYLDRQKKLNNKIEELKKILQEETKRLYPAYDSRLLDDEIHPKLISIFEYLSKLANQIGPSTRRDFQDLEEILDIVISYKDYNLQVDYRNKQKIEWLTEWQKNLEKREKELEEREVKIK